MKTMHILLSDYENQTIDDRKLDLTDVEELIISGPGKIGYYSFSFVGLKNVKKITISDDVISVEDNCFMYCDSLKELVLGNGLQYIGNMCFCRAPLTKVIIPGSVKKIGHHAFQSCASLQTVVLSEGIEEIDYNAFEDCPILEDITFPYSVYWVGSGVFSQSKWMKNHKGKYAVLGRVMFSTFKYCGGDMLTMKIPDNVEYFTRDGHELGKNVDLGINVREVPPYFAEHSYTLETLVLHDRLEKIGHHAFVYCNRLKQVHVPDSVYYIGEEAFGIEQLADAPKKGCVCLGKTVYSWVGETEEAMIPEGPVTISPKAFYKKKKLIKVVLPSSMETIFSGAFEKCQHLEFAEIPAGVTKIERGAFRECSPFTIITTKGSYAEQHAKEHDIPVSYRGEEIGPGRTAQEQEDMVRILAIKKEGGRHLQRFSLENRTYPVCLTAVTEDGSALEFVPNELRTKELCAAACKSNGIAIKMVPEKLITVSMCKDAVSIRGEALQYVPIKYRTAAVCQAAVMNRYTALVFIPENILTPAFCTKATKDKTDCKWISSIPAKIRSKEFFEELVKLQPKIITDTPKQYRTVTFCKNYLATMKYKSAADAIRANEWLIGYLNPGLYDHDTCLAIVQTELFERGYISSTRTNVIEFHKGSVQIDKLLRFPDVCIQAVKKLPRLMTYVPERFMTEDFIKQILDARAEAYLYLPEKYKTDELKKYALEKDSGGLRMALESL